MSRRRLRLLLVSPLPPPAGGIATWTQGVVNGPLSDWIDIDVVDSAPSAKQTVHGRSRLRFDRIRDALGLLARLALRLVRHRPDLVHVNTSYFWAFLRDGLAVWMASLAGARTLLHFRGGDFPEFAEGRRGPAGRFVEATLRRADRLLALTGPTRDYLERVASPERVRLVPNFVRLEDFGTPPDRSERGSGPVEVLYVGWIVEPKGIRELLAAAQALPELRFTLVGPVQPDFEASLRETLEVERHHVELLPPQPRDAVLALYRRADVFVLPTWREGFPNVVLEAMAAALPVVATPVGAIPDAVRDGCEGLLVPPRDAESLTAALRSLANDPERRRSLGRAARARAESTFSLDAVADQLASLYEELASA